MDLSKLSPGARIFSYHQRSRRILITALTASTGLLGFVVYTGLLNASTFSDIVNIASGGFFAFLIFHTMRQLRVVDDRVAVDDSGIWYLPSRGMCTSVGWSEFERVKQHNLITKSLSIVDRNGTVRIKLILINELNDVDGFMRLIQEHKASLDTSAAAAPSYSSTRGTIESIVPTVTRTAKALATLLYRLVRLICLPLILILEPLGYKPNRIAAIAVLVIPGSVWGCILRRPSAALAVAIWVPGVVLYYVFLKLGADLERNGN